MQYFSIYFSEICFAVQYVYSTVVHILTHTVDSKSRSACGYGWAWESVGGLFDVHGHEVQHVMIVLAFALQNSLLHLWHTVLISWGTELAWLETELSPWVCVPLTKLATVGIHGNARHGRWGATQDIPCSSLKGLLMCRSLWLQIGLFFLNTTKGIVHTQA